ncbi:glycosyltransferase [Marinobacter vulgaris]|nr:glycosyltransferase [Marinobacter vulgaris]TSJ70312.1 glycosyltransferase [Marinobacter vulgaris]
MTTKPNQSSLNIGILPYDMQANRYIEKNRLILEKLGTILPVPHPAKLLKTLLLNVFRTGKLKPFDVLILNWRENALRSENNSITFKTIFEYISTMVLHRLSCKKLIYVAHNRFPHNIDKKQQTTAKKIIKFGYSLSDLIVVHSFPEADPGKKIHYVPHPLYDINHDNEILNPPLFMGEFYVIIGRIQQYKNLEKVIINWPKNKSLLILGPCDNKNYLKYIKNLIKNKDIIIEAKFHSENYLKKCIEKSKGVIVSNDNESMYVSGSFFFAISCHSKVFALDSPFYRWINDTPLSPCIFSFSSIDKLIKAIENQPELAKGQCECIHQLASPLFGDDIIEDSWRRIIYN